MDRRHDDEITDGENDTPAHRPARRRRRCAVPGCGKFARSGSPFCAAHRTEATRRQDGATPTTHDSRRATHDSFKRRLESGEYRRLFGEKIAALMAQAAAEEGVDDEIAILRIVLARLMAEETDALKLAQAVARIAGVSVQAARVRRAISGQRAEEFTDAVARILEELLGK